MQIRLAERQGLLTGRHLSQPQRLSLEILMALDTKAKAVDFVRNLKSQIAALHPEEMPRLFPEWKLKKGVEAGMQEDGSFDIDSVEGSQVEWAVPSKEEAAELEKWIAERQQQGSQVMSASDLGDEEGWE